jgi:long-chain fatty acid transport protein
MRLRHACQSGLAMYLLSAAQAWAGGLMLYEIGTPDSGLAAAGWAARAQDPATVATNPAGMTRLDGDQFMVGAQVLYAGMAFSPNANTTVSGPDGQNPVRWFPGASAFYVHSLAPNWKLGLGTYGNFGLMMDNSDNWVGRYNVQDVGMLGMTLTPALAYKVNDQLSIGVGLDAMYGIFQYEVAVQNALDTLVGDGQMDLNTHDWGYGANLGVLYELHPGTRLGLDYTSAIDLNFTDTPDFTNLGPVLSAVLPGAIGQLDLSMTIPQTVMASVYHELDERWALLGNIGWQNWSEFGKVGVEVNSSTSATVNRRYNDTWHAALGAQHHFSDDWLLSFGAAYDSSMVDDADRTLDLPVGATWRFSVGSQHTLQKNLDLGLAYTLIWGGDISIDQSGGVGPFARRVTGQYENVNTHVFSANLRWRL